MAFWKCGCGKKPGKENESGMHYVYCFVKGTKEDSLFPRGLGGKKVRLVSFGGIGAVMSEGSPDDVVGNAENVLVHQKVVDKALEISRSVIPCRFGVWVADEAGIIELLRKNYPRLATCLARLEGKVEVGIKAILSGRQSANGGRRSAVGGRLTAGERYLLEKSEKYHGSEGLSEQARGLSQELHKATSPFWTAAKTEKKQVRQGVELGLFYLIERDKLSSFKDVYERLCKRVETLHCKLLYTGPWPPYSFADVTLS